MGGDGVGSGLLPTDETGELIFMMMIVNIGHYIRDSIRTYELYYRIVHSGNIKSCKILIQHPKSNNKKGAEEIQSCPLNYEVNDMQLQQGKSNMP